MNRYQQEKKRRKVIELLESGKTVKEVVKETGYSKIYVEMLRRECTDVKSDQERKSSQEVSDRMLELYNIGYTQNRIAKEFGLSQPTVRKILDSNPNFIPRERIKYDKFTIADKQAICEQYRDGISAAKLRRLYKTSNAIIYRILSEGGIEIAGRTPTARISAEDSKKMCDMYNDGISMAEIAKEFGIKNSSVRYHIHKNGQSKKYMELPAEEYVFKWDSGIKSYCYDEADDCIYNKYGRCTKVEDTIFKDEFGLRDICPHYTPK